MSRPLLVATNVTSEMTLLPARANRHGLITGATGTGKTVSLQRLAEQFSAIGVPVFMADVKGDLSGLGAKGAKSEKLAQRLDMLKITDWQPEAFPVVFWDVFGEAGHPVRATVSDMGPLLLARLLGLNDTQEGVLQLVFKAADDEGLLLLDLKDLRAVVQYVGENAKRFNNEYGRVSTASIGAIQRALLRLEAQGAEHFFGEPMLNIDDLMQTDGERGVINILAADKLLNSPKVYATFLLWLLSELFENLPEVGDPEKPKLVFFFDEAHLLFSDAPPALLEKVEQVVRLIRSKGVGVFFVTQNPLDVPDKVLGQLGNRIQHALRAFTPRDQKAVKAAAETMRPNPKIDAEAAITELAVGEALVSLLDQKGRPCITERAFVFPPFSRMGPLTPEERAPLIKGSVIFGHYENALDRESAYEKLKGNKASSDTAAEQKQQSGTGTQDSGASASSDGGFFGQLGDIWGGKGRRQGVAEALVKSVARSIGSRIGTAIVRGVLGSILGGGGKRR